MTLHYSSPTQASQTYYYKTVSISIPTSGGPPLKQDSHKRDNQAFVMATDCRPALKTWLKRLFVLGSCLMWLKTQVA